MTLDEVRRILTTSAAADWHLIESFPTYRDNIAPLGDGDPLESHYATAVYRADVRLTLAWGMSPPGDKNPHQPGSGWTWWLPGGTTISSELVDVFYCSGLVDRHVGARVDGAILPYPKPHSFTEFHEMDPSIGWTVTKWQLDFFRLIHSLRYPAGDYDSWTHRAQFVVDDS